VVGRKKWKTEDPERELELVMSNCPRGRAVCGDMLARKARPQSAQKILVRSIPDSLRGLAHNLTLIGANRHRLPAIPNRQWRQYAVELLCLLDS